MRKGIIYKYTNTKHDGYSYIGQTLFDRKTREGLECNKYDKCIVFKRAIQKYGINSFTYEILEQNVPQELLDEREQYWIAYYHTYIADPECHGYNMTIGGRTNRGRICRQETKDKVSSSLIGHAVTDKVKNHMINYNKSRKGIKPKNIEDALKVAHQKTSKKIKNLETGIIFDSKTMCAIYYQHSVQWVNARLLGNKKCKEVIFAEITPND